MDQIMELKTLELVSRPVRAVQFTGDNAAELKEFIQSKLAFHQVTVTEDRLYLPSVGGMEILESGDWVLYDSVDNLFRGATDDAITAHYREVETEEEQQS